MIRDASVIYATIASSDSKVVSWTEQSIKQTNLSEFPSKGRGAQGVRCHKFLSGEKELIGAYVGVNPKAKGVELPELSKRDASGVKVEGLNKIVISE